MKCCKITSIIQKTFQDSIYIETKIETKLVMLDFIFKESNLKIATANRVEEGRSRHDNTECKQACFVSQ